MLAHMRKTECEEKTLFSELPYRSCGFIKIPALSMAAIIFIINAMISKLPSSEGLLFDD